MVTNFYFFLHVVHLHRKAQEQQSIVQACVEGGEKIAHERDLWDGVKHSTDITNMRTDALRDLFTSHKSSRFKRRFRGRLTDVRNALQQLMHSFNCYLRYLEEEQHLPPGCLEKILDKQAYEDATDSMLAILHKQQKKFA